MENTRHFFTSESVTEGHPDKVCDQISDAVLDAILAQDETAHVACETIATTGMVLVMGEISTDCYVDIPAIARQVVRDIGYDDANQGFDGNTCSVLTVIDEQSPDIAMGVNDALEARELIKGRVLENSMLSPREAAEQLAPLTRSEVVQVIGRKFSLYRESSRKDIEKIKLV